eukprot:scaffold7423_cov122-Cylindrotheca_fusiformis.AAC.3
MKQALLLQAWWKQGNRSLVRFNNTKVINNYGSSIRRELHDGESLPLLLSDFQKPLGMFAACLPGLEPYLKAELKSLAFKRIQTGSGGVHFSAASAEEIFKCHLFLGTASHIYIRAGPTFRATSMTDLRKSITKMPFWEMLLMRDGTGNSKPSLDIRVSASKSRLYHTTAVAERVERGICNALGVNINDEEVGPSLRLLVRIHRDEVQVSVDTSNTPLHQRGYRLETAKAPLREDLAHAMLLSSGFGSRTRSVLDPFCGSGTILIEAAAMASKLPPGRLRDPPLQGLAFQNDAYWHGMVKSAIMEDALDHDPSIQIFGSDRDQGAIEIARRNASRAGVDRLVDFEHNAISSNSWFEDPSRAPDGRFLVATNPPFGHRIKVDSKMSSLLPLYQTFGNMVKPLDADVVILGHDVNLIRQTGIPNLKLRFASKHGGKNVFALGANNNRSV